MKGRLERVGPFFVVTHSVYWGMTDKRRSLFAEADRSVQSTLVPSRRVSWFAGKVFRATYGIRNTPNSQTKVLGRLMDLQPAMEGGKIAGLMIQFRLYEEGNSGAIRQSQDREVRNLNLGPFDTVLRETVTASAPGQQADDSKADGGDIKFPIGNFANTYSMIQENLAPGAENRYLKISFVMES